MMLPLMSNCPASLMARNRQARVGCGPARYPSSETKPGGRLGSRAFWAALVVGADLERGAPGKRRHRGNADPFARGFELLGQRVGADEGDVDEGRMKTSLVREPDELGARP